MDKLRDITKNTVSLMSAEQVYSELIKWTEKYDRVFHNLLTENPKYALDILSKMCIRDSKSTFPTVWKCSICGHTHTADTPWEICPVCGHPMGYVEFNV